MKHYILAHKDHITEELEALGANPADLDGDHVIYSEPTGETVSADWEPDQTADAEGKRNATPRGILVAMAKKLYNPTNRLRMSHGDLSKSLRTPEMRMHRGHYEKEEDLIADATELGIVLTGNTFEEKKTDGKTKVKNKLK